MITLADITAARLRIAPFTRETPVMPIAALREPLACPASIVMKLELFQVTGSFKARGAFNSLLSMPVPAAGVIAASGGNHGAAVAFAAQSLGHKA